MGSQRAGCLAVILLLSAMATGHAAGASTRTTSVRFVGRVPATCHHQQRQQPSVRTTDSLRSFQYTSRIKAGNQRLMTCVFY